MRDEAEKRIGHLYPKVEVTAEMATERPDLKPYVGKKLTVIAWLWARTVKSPNPAFSQVDVPLASTFVLASKPGKKAYVEPDLQDGGYRFTVKAGKSRDLEAAKSGTKLSRGNFWCLLSRTPISGDYIRAESQAGRMGTRLMAIVAEGDRERIYLSPSLEMEEIAQNAQPDWKPEVEFFAQALGFRIGNYGMTKWSDLFTARQLTALTTLADLVQEARALVSRDARAAGLLESASLDGGGTGATAYGDAVAVYLAFAVDRSADFWSNLCIWANQPKNELVTHLFGRQAIPMAWDFGEVNPFSNSGGNFLNNLEYVAKGVLMLPAGVPGRSVQKDAASVDGYRQNTVFSTDPPYYDNIGYADLSDYFYMWMRRSLKPLFPGVFSTVTVPKAEELVATPARHGGRDAAESFFLEGMTRTMQQIGEHAHPAFPVTIYYAFKQAENDDNTGTANTGWETFLDAVMQAGFATTGTWPVRTERPGRMRDNSSNALASSIVLVCRPRSSDAPTATRRDFLNQLKAELPGALRHLQRGNIAPVDLAQAAIGPGMAVYTRFARVLDATGQPLSVRDALVLINQTLDEVLAEQEGDFDTDSRWAVTWFDEFGFAEGDYGRAEQLSKSKNTSVDGMARAGILVSRAGKVRLLRPAELPADWDPATDSRLSHWEEVHQLIRALEAEGESAAAALVTKLGPAAETARELAYRLYTICERKKRAAEALSYNGLVQSWPEILRLAQVGPAAQPGPAQMELV
jgi:putative DNA methylase